MIYYYCTECEQIEPESEWANEPGNKTSKHCGTCDKDVWPSPDIVMYINNIPCLERLIYAYN